MATNKVVLANGETLIDLSNDSVTPRTMAAGTTAHDSTGALIVGTATEVELVQTTGNSETAVMSQKAVTDVANQLSEEIVDLKGGEIPDYWQEHIDGKIARIKTLQDEGGKDCFSFIVMTDMHYPSNLGKNSPILAKKILDECDIRYALCLGDVQTRGCHATKELLLAENVHIEEMLSPIRDRLLQTQGNHDGNYGTLNGENYVYRITPQELYGAIYRKVGVYADCHFDESGSGYWVDDTSAKVRYIILNTHNTAYELNADGTQKYPNMELFRFGQSQYDLVIDALNTVPSGAWSVVVAGHVALGRNGGYSPWGDGTEAGADCYLMENVLKAYRTKTAFSGSFTGTAEGGARYTNQLAKSTDTTGAIYNGTGYKDGYRLSSSLAESQLTGAFVTGYIPVKAGDVIRLNGNYILDTHTSASSMNNVFTLSDYNISTRRCNFAWSAVKEKTLYQGLSDIVRNNEGYITQFTINPDYDYVENWKTADLRMRLTLVGSGKDCVITVNEEIVEAATGYDFVEVDADFSNANGELVGFFAGHTHADYAYPVGSYGITTITTRCDAHEENKSSHLAEYNERQKDTTTEQSFDVFTVNKAQRKIYATKIGAGENRVITY